VDVAYNYAVGGDEVAGWQTASGGISFDENQAIMASVGEALERYTGAVTQFEVRDWEAVASERVVAYDEWALFAPEQYQREKFPFVLPTEEKMRFGRVFDLRDNSEWWVPQELIGLGSRTSEPLLPSTSTGLAAHVEAEEAILAGLYELLERDALAVTWLNSLGGREISLEEEYVGEVRRRGGQIWAFDVTQKWNPYPVVMVAGNLPLRGKARISLGVSCRCDWRQAKRKAYLEWLQGVYFTNFFLGQHPDLEFERPEQVTSFDLHAAYYTKYPEKWEQTPLIKNKVVSKRKKEEREQVREKWSASVKIGFLIKELAREKIRIFYKNLTGNDVEGVGGVVVRVMSPELANIHGDENWPFLGGRTRDVGWRYPEWRGRGQINKYPHPLG
jgi:ribosomal protein S12 methylthiotransferase accessory factor